MIFIDPEAEGFIPTTEYVKEEYCSDDGRYFEEYEAGFDRWLAEVKAQAWDEGYVTSACDIITHSTPNPYRQQTQ